MGLLAILEQNPAFLKRYMKEAKILYELFDVILDRKINPRDGSYTTRLFSEGKEKIHCKLREELEEVIADSEKDNRDRIIYETADLLYHLIVLLGFHNINPDNIFSELKKRRK